MVDEGSPTTKNNVGVATLLTPRGRGAVAVIVCKGELNHLELPSQTLFKAANGKQVTEQLENQVLFGQWGTEATEDVVVCRTDNETLEIHCHGGHAAVERVLSDLAEVGFEIVPWQDYQTACQGIFATEIQTALSQARTSKTACLILQQNECLQGEVESLIATSSQIDDSNTEEQLAFQLRLSQLVENAKFGQHLVKPFRVVLAGQPNVGKSSLINALVGYDRAIVFDQPGTTRDIVKTETAFEGWPVELTDTAGLRTTEDELESAGIERAREMLAVAEARVLLFDVTQPLTTEDHQLISDWPTAILVAHKVDLGTPQEELLKYEPLAVSSVQGEGLAALMERLVQQLVPHEPTATTPLPFTPRQLELLEQTQTASHQQNWKKVGDSLKQLIQ